MVSISVNVYKVIGVNDEEQNDVLNSCSKLHFKYTLKSIKNLYRQKKMRVKINNNSKYFPLKDHEHHWTSLIKMKEREKRRRNKKNKTKNKTKKYSITYQPA